MTLPAGGRVMEVMEVMEGQHWPGLKAIEIETPDCRVYLGIR